MAIMKNTNLKMPYIVVVVDEMSDLDAGGWQRN